MDKKIFLEGNKVTISFELTPKEISILVQTAEKKPPLQYPLGSSGG